METPQIVKTYSVDKQQEIIDYLAQLTAHEKIAYHIASSHLETSFDIYRSNGFIEWKKLKIKP
jgi:hypothetical protein